LRIALTLVCLAALGCAPARTPKHEAKAAAGPCSEPVDVRALLERHTRTYGTPEDVRAQLPISFEGATTGGWAFQGALDETRYRAANSVGPVLLARGIDAHGPWTIDADGVPVRPTAAEKVYEPSLAAWVLRRDFVREPTWKAWCSVDGRVVAKASGRPDLGQPELLIDPTNAEVLAAHAPGVVLEIGDWSNVIGSVRWPRTLHAPRLRAEGMKASLAPQCRAAEACFGPGERVRVAARPERPRKLDALFSSHRVLVRVLLDGHEAWGALDSGAGALMVDPSSAGAHPAPVARSLSVGGLTLTDVPAFDLHPGALVDPQIATTIELLVGFPLLKHAAVRIDYAASEVTIATSASELVSSSAIAAELIVHEGDLLTYAEVEASHEALLVDTGSPGFLSLDTRWADAHGIPGGRPATHVRGVFGLGGGPSDGVAFTTKRVAIGPIAGADVPTLIYEMRRRDRESRAPTGLVGNQLLSRCKAVILDVNGRTVSFEPPCR
jgi:hypothetical protein